MKTKLFAVKLKVGYSNHRETVVKIVTECDNQDEACAAASKIVASWNDVINIECLDMYQFTKRPKLTKKRSGSTGSHHPAKKTWTHSKAAYFHRN